jgi:murein L,D-transpeptidase YafK
VASNERNDLLRQLFANKGLASGSLGPKRRFGDEQVPEGFYELDWFNPQSNST